MKNYCCISVEPKIQPFGFDDEGAMGGTSTRLMCVVLSGDLPMNIIWLKDGDKIEKSNAKTHQLDDYTAILSLSQLSLSDSGSYSCVASNNAGNVSHSSELKVKGICAISEDFNVLSTYLTIRVDFVYIASFVTFPVLPLALFAVVSKLVCSENSLFLECAVCRKVYVELAFHTISLAFFSFDPTEKPQIEPFSFNSQGVNGGTTTKVMCTILAGDLPVHFNWLKDGLPLKSDSKRIQQLDDFTSILLLPRLTLHDAANYTCEARNEAGMSTHSSVLRVKGTIKSH